MNRNENTLLVTRSRIFRIQSEAAIKQYQCVLQDCLEKEEAKLDRMPESLEGTDIWQFIEEIIDALSAAIGELDNVTDSIGCVFDALGIETA